MAKVISALKSSSVNVGNSQGVFSTGTISSTKTSYTITGTTSIVIPAGVTQISVKCWGAAGGGSITFTGGSSRFGGGGAYASSTINVTPGDTYVATVGAGGVFRNAAGTYSDGGGNNASGNGGGGNVTANSNPAGGQAVGGGGQYSAIHKFTGTNYILLVAAGGGGGAVIGADGGGGGCTGNNGGGHVGSTAQPGSGGTGGTPGFNFVNPGPGSNYVASATTTGSTAMNLNSGTGGPGANNGNASSPGGGGGFGGGGGGEAGSASGAAGGGSFGVTIVNGAQTGGTAGNNGDADYIAGKGLGVTGANGGDGLVVVQFNTVGTIFSSNVTFFSGTLGGTELSTTESKALVASVTDGTASNLQLAPTYTNSTASAFTVTRHNYGIIKNPVLTNTGGGSIAITDAVVWQFDAAAGTHKAVDTSTTKTTPGAVDAWVKINVNGTIMYTPCYLSKTA